MVVSSRAREAIARPRRQSGAWARSLHSSVRHRHMGRALWALRGVRVALGLGVAFIGGCVELPGFYYNVLVNEAPFESDCVKLTDALTERLNLKLQPSPNQCSVVLDSVASTPRRSVAIVTYVRQRRIQVEINELSSGSPTVPSPSTEQFAQQVVHIVQEQFPTAEVERFRPKRGPIPP